jgi:lipoprotein signal peptidase
MPISPWTNLRSPAALLRFIVPTVLGLALDAWSKAVAENTLSDGSVDQFIPGWLNFRYTMNHGAVFGLGQGQRWLFIGVSILAIGFLTYLFLNSGRQRFYQIILGMLLAGVLGNMADRIRFGYVRDMIYALPDWHWPGAWTLMIINYPAGPDRDVFPWIFNVADTLLCAGVCLMVVYSLVHRPPNESSTDLDQIARAKIE